MSNIEEVLSENALVFYILAASVVELTAAGIVCDNVPECSDYLAYAVAVGAVSTGLTFIQAILCFANAGAAQKFAPWLSLFLFIWWIPGAGVPTFETPFLYAGNGYFSCWVALIVSAIYFQGTGLPALTGKGKPKEGAVAPEPEPKV